MYYGKPESASEVLNYAAQRAKMGDNPLYIICGRSGPTGKTWLCNRLQEAGYNAVEISEGINYLVEYRDNRNHISDMGFNQVIIVLNKRLDGMWKM